MRLLFLSLCLINATAALWWSVTMGAGEKAVVPGRERIAGLDLLAEQTDGKSDGKVQNDGCILYGPMAASRARTLAAAVDGATVVETRRSQPGEIWLYLPVGGDGADRVISELASGGIESFVFLGGALAGNVALGGYSRPGAAALARERYVAMGYDVAMHEMTREIIDYWVAVSAGRGADSAAAAAARLGLAEEKSEMVENSCETVASGGQFP